MPKGRFTNCFASLLVFTSLIWIDIVCKCKYYDYIDSCCFADADFLNGGDRFLNGGAHFLNRGARFLNRGAYFLNRGAHFLNRDAYFLNANAFCAVFNPYLG